MNGTLVQADQARVPVTDHGLTTGDGVFEALKVTGGTPFALTRHLARLSASARGLGLPDPDLDAIRAGVDAVLAGAGRPDRAGSGSPSRRASRRWAPSGPAPSRPPSSCSVTSTTPRPTVTW